MENARKFRLDMDMVFLGLILGLIIGSAGLPLAYEAFGPVRGPVFSLIVGLIVFLMISLSSLLDRDGNRKSTVNQGCQD